MAIQDRLILTPDLMERIAAAARSANACRVCLVGREDSITTVLFCEPDDVAWRHLPVPALDQQRQGGG